MARHNRLLVLASNVLGSNETKGGTEQYKWVVQVRKLKFLFLV